MSERLRELREGPRPTDWEKWNTPIVPAGDPRIESHDDAADYAGLAAEVIK
jgi:hypothetical protein